MKASTRYFGILFVLLSVLEIVTTGLGITSFHPWIKPLLIPSLAAAALCALLPEHRGWQTALLANALLLPTIMEFNMPARIEKYGVIARTMGVDTTGMTAEQAAQAAVDAVRSLAIRVGIPQHLSDLGITEKDIPALAEQALADVCTPGNPRDVTLEDIVALYKKVL